LSDINNQYNLDSGLFKKLIRSINYDHLKKLRDFDFFMDELPYKLRIELAMAIHREVVESIGFFQGKDQSFVIWVVKFLHPSHFQEQEYIYKEGENVTEVSFLISGLAGFVLPRFDNTVYIKIETGDHFGHTDIIIDDLSVSAFISITSPQIPEKPLKSKDYIRRFTTQALIDCEMLQLSVEDIERMKFEFPDIFIELFVNNQKLLVEQLEIKLEAVKLCEQELILNKTR
jgi:CRP-like cAMP-binding protein